MNRPRQEHDLTAVDSMYERAIIDIGIPPCPAILNRFMAEANKEEPGYHRLAGIIGTDVSLSAALVKTANSPYFGLHQPARSVNEALSLLGLKVSSRAVAGIILRDTFPKELKLERFWDASARIARLSGWLVQYLNMADVRADEAYSFGLFRDCGIPVLLGKFPQYEKTLSLANQDMERGFTEVEAGALSTNHALVGHILARSWWLPEDICLAIREHHNLSALHPDSSKLPKASRKLIATTQLAEHIVQRQLGQGLTQEWQKLGEACLQLLNIGEALLAQLYNDAAPVVAYSD